MVSGGQPYNSEQASGRDSAISIMTTKVVSSSYTAQNEAPSSQNAVISAQPN